MSIDISDVLRRVQYTGSAGTGPYPFTFEILANTDIDVYKNSTLLTLTTDYSVTINVDGTGSITLVSAAVAADDITIVGDRAIQRNTDFVTGGDLLANSLNDELDSLTIYAQQLEEQSLRALKVPPYDDPTLDMTIPDVASRGGKFLAFDTNGEPIATNASSTGDPADASAIVFTPAGTGAVETNVQTKLREVVSVFDFMTATQIAAVKNNTVLDVTSAVQDAIDYIETVRAGTLVFPAGDYRVTQITLGSIGARLGTTYDFNNSNIIGIASTATKSIVQIKCGSATILNMAVSGGQSANYECGVHWYTNDLNTYYPGLNRIDGMLISGCVVGLCIGALPSQSDPIPAQGDVAAEGVATDAPISECYVGGLRTQDCITGVYMRQPNGKLTFISPTITTSNSAWAGTGLSAEANCNALYVHNSELTILGGFIENIDDTAGTLAWNHGSTLNIIGTCLEGKSAIKISSRVTLNMSNIQNWGMNNDSMSFFRILDSADGCLNLSDTFLRRGYGTSSTVPPIKTVSDLSTGAASVSGKFWVNATNVEFGDCNFTQGSTYNPLVYGCKSKFKNCWATTHSAVDPYPTTVSLKLDEGTNLLAGKVDLAADVITAYGVNGGATSGGWIFTNASGTSSWGSTATSLPTIEGLTANNALRLTAAGGGATTSATSPKFVVEPQRTYLLKGWMKTNATGSQNILRFKWYDFGGTAASTAETNAYVGAVGANGTTWCPFMLWVQAPKDATQAEVFLYSENGSELWTVVLEVV